MFWLTYPLSIEFTLLFIAVLAGNVFALVYVYRKTKPRRSIL